MKTRTYTQEFKQEATQLAIQEGNIKSTASQLGIPEATLYTWVNKAKYESAPSTTASNTDENSKKNTVNDLIEEVKRLRKALSLAEQEKAILKKATIFFAMEHT